MEEVPILSAQHAEADSMAEAPATPPPGQRRDEDVALDLMKFIAMTTGYGKAGGPGPGFQAAAATRSDDYADHLLKLFTRCLDTVRGKK